MVDNEMIFKIVFIEILEGKIHFISTYTSIDIVFHEAFFMMEKIKLPQNNAQSTFFVGVIYYFRKASLRFPENCSKAKIKAIFPVEAFRTFTIFFFNLKIKLSYQRRKELWRK